MVGIFVNTSAIIIGSIAGSIFKKGIKEKYQISMLTAMGLAALGIGINSIVSNMSNSEYPVLFIISLAVGSLVGTMLNLEKKFNGVLDKFSLGHLGTGLSTAILLFCMGSLSILGPIESAIHGNHTYLFTNATLDLITSMALASTFGIGIIFSAVVLFLWQSSIYLGAVYLAPFLTPALMHEISIVGGFLILASGLSILKLKDFQSMNMLPSLLIPVIWFIIINFF